MREENLYAFFLDKHGYKVLIVDNYDDEHDKIDGEYLLLFNNSPEHVLYCNFDTIQNSDYRENNMLGFYKYPGVTTAVVDQEDLIHIVWERLSWNS